MDKVNVYTDANGYFRWERRSPTGKVLDRSKKHYESAKDCIDSAFKSNKGATTFFLGQPIVGFQQ